jgi:hypothetical protein
LGNSPSSFETNNYFFGGSQTAIKLICKRAGMHYGMNEENGTIRMIFDAPFESTK